MQSVLAPERSEHLLPQVLRLDADDPPGLRHVRQARHVRRGAPPQPLAAPKKVAVVITVHDAPEWVERTLTSLWAHADSPAGRAPPDAGDAIFLVNDASGAETLRRLREVAEARGRSGASRRAWSTGTAGIDAAATRAPEPRDPGQRPPGASTSRSAS